MEQVFSQYMQRRLKAEEFAKKQTKEMKEKQKYDKQRVNEHFAKIRQQHEQLQKEELRRRRQLINDKINKGRHKSQSPHSEGASPNESRSPSPNRSPDLITRMHLTQRKREWS